MITDSNGVGNVVFGKKVGVRNLIRLQSFGQQFLSNPLL